jgi:hypothetical protein
MIGGNKMRQKDVVRNFENNKALKVFFVEDLVGVLKDIETPAEMI